MGTLTICLIIAAVFFVLVAVASAIALSCVIVGGNAEGDEYDEGDYYD